MSPTPPPLYTDENVSGILIRALQRLGWDVVRAIDTHPAGTEDEVHFQTATDQGRVLVSHDTDMLVLAARWQTDGRDFPGLIYSAPDKFATAGEAIRAIQAAVADQDENPLAKRVHFL